MKHKYSRFNQLIIRDVSVFVVGFSTSAAGCHQHNTTQHDTTQHNTFSGF